MTAQDMPPARSADFRHYENFDFLRLVAAAAVMFSHAFLIADGNEEREPFAMLLGQHNVLGLYSVLVFLLLSGFLVSRSAEMSSSVASFLWKRALRIYPGLIACALILGLVVAPAYSTLNWGAFLDSGMGLDFALSTILDPGAVWRIDTVSFYADETGWLSQVIAGTLWTVPQELLCYLLLAGMMFFSLNRLKVLVPLFVIVMAVRLNPAIWASGLPTQFLFLLPSFLAGCILWHLREKLHGQVAVIGVFATVIVAASGELFMLFPLVAGYPFIYFATSRAIRLPSVAKYGDLSFGIYLWGWPVAQICRGMLGDGVTWWSVWLLSTALTLPIAWLSWHLVEKPALSFKTLPGVLQFRHTATK